MGNESALGVFARRLRLVTIGAAAVLVAMSAAAIAVPEVRHVTVEAGGMPRAWASAIAMAVVLLVVLALAQLVRMLGRIERGPAFTRAATRDFRRFAMLLLVAVVARLTLAPLVQLALVLLGQTRHFELSLDDTDVVMLVVAGVLFLVTRLFDEAARIEEDNRSIV